MPRNLKFALYLLSIIVVFPVTASHAMAARKNEIVFGQQHAGIQYTGHFDDAQKRVIQQWLQRATQALGTVYGEMPKDYFEFVVERSASLSSPVPWGHIERGQPTRVVLVVNPAAGLEKLLADWTVFHELSHLLLPYRGYGDIWFSEGLATYYQNIVQTRSGLLYEEEMWQRIAAGLARGRMQDDLADLTLSQISADMRETRQFMRIHWSGVLYWLNVDTALRESGKGTLDQALWRLKSCCQDRAMTAANLARKLDALSGTKVFAPLFNRYRASHGLPEYRVLLAKLGIDAEEGPASVRLHDAAPWAAIRRSISGR